MTDLFWPLKPKIVMDEILGRGFFAPSQPPGSKTFAEWHAEGMRIIKGSKHVGRNSKGEPVFSGAQVCSPPRPRVWLGDHDGDWDDDRYEDPFDFAGAMDPW